MLARTWSHAAPLPPGAGKSSRTPSCLSIRTSGPATTPSAAASARSVNPGRSSIFRFSIAYAGMPATIALTGLASRSINASVSAIALRLSRISVTAGQITPPLPSPPIGESHCFITETTFASPTADRRTFAPNRPAISSTIRLVERFATSVAPAFTPAAPSSASAPSASVYSSPMYAPDSSRIASRSASGSCAKPTSAPTPATIRVNSARFSRVGSGACGNTPLASALTCVSTHPSDSSSMRAPADPLAFTESTTTLNRRRRMRSTSATRPSAATTRPT